MTFGDGTPMDAAAVKVNLDRHREARESRRKAELASIGAVEVVDPLTVQRIPSQPDAPLLAVLADRAGMMKSPRAIAALGERVTPSDVASVERHRSLRLIAGTAMAYPTMTFNPGATERAKRPPGSDPSVRAALETAIDRTVIIQVALEGRFVPSNQFKAPGSTSWVAERPVPPRDVAEARALLRETGHERVAFELAVPNSPVERRWRR